MKVMNIPMTIFMNIPMDMIIIITTMPMDTTITIITTMDMIIITAMPITTKQVR